MKIHWNTFSISISSMLQFDVNTCRKVSTGEIAAVGAHVTVLHSNTSSVEIGEYTSISVRSGLISCPDSYPFPRSVFILV